MAEPAPVELVTPRLRLTMLPAEDAQRQLDYYLRNRAHLGPWEPTRPPGFYSTEFWAWRLEQSREDYLHDRALRLQVVARDAPDGPVLGQVSFTEIIRGALHQAFVGYSLDRDQVGRGLMAEALGVAIKVAFGRLALHRVAASYLPENVRSARLLERLGFTVEGTAREYLYIHGAWRDHVLAALVNHDMTEPGR